MKSSNPTSIYWKDASARERVLLHAMTILFAQHQNLLEFVFDPSQPRLKQAPELLIARSCALSHGERLLIRVALDIWNGSGAISLYEITDHFDSETYHSILAALEYIGPKRLPPHRPHFKYSRRADCAASS